jgi:hypothetical protein
MPQVEKSWLPSLSGTRGQGNAVTVARFPDEQPAQPARLGAQGRER